MDVSEAKKFIQNVCDIKNKQELVQMALTISMMYLDLELEKNAYNSFKCAINEFMKQEHNSKLDFDNIIVGETNGTTIS